MQLLEQPYTVHVVHAQIGEHKIGPETSAGRERCGRGVKRLYFVILGTQPDGQQAQQPRVIVNDQDACLARLRRRGFALGGLLQAKAQRHHGSGGMRGHELVSGRHSGTAGSGRR